MLGSFAVLTAALLFALPATASAWENDLSEVTISETGGLSERTLAALDTMSAVLGVEPTVMQSGTIRMLEVNRGDVTIQSFAPGFAVPMSFTAVDPDRSAPLLGAEISGALGRGVVMSEATAALRGAQPGDDVTLEAWNGTIHTFPISAVVPDGSIGWTELLFGTDVATTLGIDRPSRAVMWGVNTTLVDLLTRAVLGDAPIRVSGPGSEREPFVDWVLPLVQVKERFGEFSFAETNTDRIETDDVWYEANMVTVVLPRLGQFQCHRLVMPYVEGALAELEASGLANEIDPEDFQLAGGCYNARLARGGDLDRGFALSRHSWGIAIDFNPSTNSFGAETSLSDPFGNVLRDWGFAWGAGWRIADGMHFEWHAEPVDSGRSECATRLALSASPSEFGEPARTCS